ncbi:Putative S-adenosyl-L-methionine-dependent methyltransferase ML2640 [Nocardia africana]|uniref:S-adenosyl-L-methionine-dependent methyltransferase ML2640 n=3 Tax=Nocardia africana TaxID=134964 RepID=A0A378WW57_9NOCA|nr:Putative S-adenosyl-L-methionine-dependent methyltransferase ML2640 [Nocardia africana]
MPTPRDAPKILCIEILVRRSGGYLPMATDKADTSFMPMVIAACEQRESPQQRLLTDGLAATMLPAPLRALLRLRVVRTRLAVLMDRDAPGIWNSIACRKRYLDDAVAQAIADGITQIVVLGAGFDTRAARFTAASEVTAVEVDLPRTVTRKRSRLGESRVVLAAIDFEHDDLATVLTAHGYDPARPAIIVWEGVTQYLTADAVRDTLRALDNAAPGTRHPAPGSPSPMSVRSFWTAANSTTRPGYVAVSSTRGSGGSACVLPRLRNCSPVSAGTNTSRSARANTASATSNRWVASGRSRRSSAAWRPSRTDRLRQRCPEMSAGRPNRLSASRPLSWETRCVYSRWSAARRLSNTRRSRDLTPGGRARCSRNVRTAPGTVDQRDQGAGTNFSRPVLLGATARSGSLSTYRGRMAGYSGAPLARKLGIRPGSRVLLANAPSGFALEPLPEQVCLQRRAGRGQYDVIVGFCPDYRSLDRGFGMWRARLTLAGGLWVAWPKKSSGVVTDLSDTVVREFGLAAGLVDNKTCAIDETWSGLRFVVRLADRH